MELHESPSATIEQRENVLALVGDFDIFSAEKVGAKIDACAASGGPVTVDLRRCTYVDSTILTVLVRAANAYGGQLEMLVPSSGNVARILALTTLDRYLPIV